MTTWEALILGIIQGLTEFLPISSSGHLKLAQYFLGWQNLEAHVLFDLTCHLGTLCAIIYFFAQPIKQVLSTPFKLGQVILGTLPLVPLVFFLKPIKHVLHQPQWLGFCFLISATLIFASSWIHFRSKKQTWSDSLIIGCFQACAVLPGISRSGSTISAARLLGWEAQEAATFSFLLAIPAILGATCIELLQLLFTSSTPTSFHLGPFVVGFLTAFVTGCLALSWLKKLLYKDCWIYFGWYCLALGLVTTAYFYYS